ncbi:MAG TPA: hypothetical protein VEB22_09490 [Phycisphaerales bacterium]|nr:hypothetical protein [Phycisphaerales bacterium]
MHRATLALASSHILTASAHAGVHVPTFFLHDYAFSTNAEPSTPAPNTLTVNAGETVRWVWVANFHSVLQVEGPGLAAPFHSALTDEPGFTFEYTFYIYARHLHVHLRDPRLSPDARSRDGHVGGRSQSFQFLRSWPSSSPPHRAAADNRLTPPEAPLKRTDDTNQTST